MAVATLPLLEEPVSTPVERFSPPDRQQLLQSARKLRVQLHVLVEQGVLVNVDARGFHLVRQTDWQSLGIIMPRQATRAVRPPRVLLVHPDYYRTLSTIPDRAHQLLASHSFRLSAVEALLETPSYRWVPWTAWESFEQKFEALRKELAQVLDRMEQDWPRLRREMIAIYGGIARSAARRLLAAGATSDPELARRNIRLALVAQALGPRALRERLGISFKVGLVVPDSELLAEQARVARAEAEMARARAIAAMAEAERQARERQLQLQLRAREEELRREAELKERLRQLQLEEARRRFDQTLAPVEEAAQQLAAAVYHAASSLRQTLDKRGHLPSSSCRRIRQLVQRFRQLDWVGMEELEQELQQLLRLAGPARRRRAATPGDLARQLDSIIRHCYADAQALASSSRLGSIEL